MKSSEKDIIQTEKEFLAKVGSGSLKKQNSKQNISKKDEQILRYRSILIGKENENSNLLLNNFNSKVLFHPIKFYLQKQKAFERKLRYYTPTIFRKFSVGNNSSYFRVMMKRYFYYYKPNLRWERTMKLATLRKARRKTSRKPRKIQIFDQEINNSTTSLLTNKKINEEVGILSTINQKNKANIENTDMNIINFESTATKSPEFPKMSRIKKPKKVEKNTEESLVM
jgi:hypothetical protein